MQAAIAGLSVGVLDTVLAQTPLSPWNWTHKGWIVTGAEAAVVAVALNMFGGFNIRVLEFAVVAGFTLDAVSGPLLQYILPEKTPNAIYMGLANTLAGAAGMYAGLLF